MTFGAVLRRITRWTVSAVALVLILLDEVARPLFRPLSRAFSHLRLVAMAEAAVRRLPPYGVLACLLMPLAVVEPLKVAALVWIGEGRLVIGIASLAFAYLATFLLVDRIYHAGREKLLAIRWFAAVMARLVGARDWAMGPIRRSPPYIFAREIAVRMRGDILRLLGGEKQT